MIKPIRTCLVTGQKHEKKDLLRFVINEGVLVFDQKQKLPGRGGYVLATEKNLEKLKKLGGKICHFLKVKRVEMNR